MTAASFDLGLPRTIASLKHPYTTGATGLAGAMYVEETFPGQISIKTGLKALIELKHNYPPPQHELR
jgi:hypothetical protein